MPGRRFTVGGFGVRPERMMETDQVTGATNTTESSPATPTTTPATKPTPAPTKAPEAHVAAATTLVTRRGLNGTLAPADADRIAARLVGKHGLDAVLAAIAGLSDVKITHSLKKATNLGGYLYQCLDRLITEPTATEPVPAPEPAPAPAKKPAPSAPPTPASPAQPFKTQEAASDEEAYRREIAAENQREQEHQREEEQEEAYA